MEWMVTLNTMPAVAKDFWECVGDHKIFAVHGNMGVGKTTFIIALCQAKGFNGLVSSPSFSIINEYQSLHGNIFHVDLYRLKNEEEAFRAGVEDCLYSGAICLVEWPEKARGIFPSYAVNIYITSVDPETRKIQAEASP